MHETKNVLAYWDYDRSYDRNRVIELATGLQASKEIYKMFLNHFFLHSHTCIPGINIFKPLKYPFNASSLNIQIGEKNISSFTLTL